MLSALALFISAMTGVAITLMILSLRARQDRKAALVARLRGAWRWRR